MLEEKDNTNKSAMRDFGIKDLLSGSRNFGIKALLYESRRLLEESKSNDIFIITPTANLSPDIKEIFENFSMAIQNYQDRAHYDIMKYKLANKALQTGLWDMEVIDGDPINPNNTFIWSNEFRHMLGFSDENDFSNKLNSWSDRIHPEDKEQTLEAFAKHLTDYSGQTPYNLKNRLRMKNGEYHFFQALGDTIRDDSGRPLRVAGLLLDIEEEKKVEELTTKVMVHISQASGFISEINELVHELDSTIDSETAAVNESSALTEKIVNALKFISEISQKEQDSMNELINKAAQGQKSMRKTIQSVQDIAKLVDGIAQTIEIISEIADDTNLLSLNAAIEAAHAGDAGKSFGVVANEIRRLSDSTRQNSVNISQILENIIEGIAVTTKQSGNTENRITEMSNEINGFAQTITSLINTLNKLAEESGEVTASLNNLKKQNTTVKTGHRKMLTMTKELNDAILELNKNKSERDKVTLH